MSLSRLLYLSPKSDNSPSRPNEEHDCRKPNQVMLPIAARTAAMWVVQEMEFDDAHLEHEERN
jgi:hypothetical protein